MVRGMLTIFRFSLKRIRIFLQKCYPDIGRWSKMAKVFSMYFLNVLLSK